MQEFLLYLKLGFEHILDLNGYDHILFVVTLCAGYPVGQWKKIAILVSAFTLGHCLTLVLSALDLIHFSPSLVELLIPVTILLTAVLNLFRSADKSTLNARVLSYLLAAGFGLIHGMGFSTYFKALLGSTQSIIFPLFSFNLGIEGGQLSIVAIFLGLSYFIFRFFKTDRREWQVFMSGLGAGASILLILERL